MCVRPDKNSPLTTQLSTKDHPFLGLHHEWVHKLLTKDHYTYDMRHALANFYYIVLIYPKLQRHEHYGRVQSQCQSYSPYSLPIYEDRKTSWVWNNLKPDGEGMQKLFCCSAFVLLTYSVDQFITLDIAIISFMLDPTIKPIQNKWPKCWAVLRYEYFFLNFC